MFILNYYRIDRAANLLECEIDDIITLWASGYIDLHIELKAMRTTIERINDEIVRLKNVIDVDEYQRKDKEHSIRWFLPEEEIQNRQVEDGKITIYKQMGIAFGLWKIIPTITTIFIENNLCLFNHYNRKKITNRISSAYIVGNYHEETGYDYIINDEIIEINKNELILLKEDFLIIKNNEGDFQRKDNHEDNNFERIKSLKPVHPTAERHAANREKILIAAIRFQREQPNVFNEQCFKKNGDINYSAFARELMERPHLFPDGCSPLKTIEPIISTLKSAYELRHKKK